MNLKIDHQYKNDIFSSKQLGLPKYYPTPCKDKNPNLLFYIQRSLNTDTVIYQLNTNHDGHINLDQPMNVYWRKYMQDGQKKDINLVQEKLAFGYSYNIINHESISFCLAGYRKFKFFLGKSNKKEYGVFSKIRGELSQIHKIYVFAEDYGIFTDVKYAEIYSTNVKTGEPGYYKIINE